MNHGYPPRIPVGAPQGGPTQRLNELLDSIRAEFETESQRSVDYEGQSECILHAMGFENDLFCINTLRDSKKNLSASNVNVSFYS